MSLPSKITPGMESAYHDALDDWKTRSGLDMDLAFAWPNIVKAYEDSLPRSPKTSFDQKLDDLTKQSIATSIREIEESIAEKFSTLRSKIDFYIGEDIKDNLLDRVCFAYDPILFGDGLVNDNEGVLPYQFIKQREELREKMRPVVEAMINF